MNITQPALSRTISRLEEDIGTPLFERVGRQIRLNPYGRIFLSHLERSFMELDQAKKKIRDMARLEQESVTIATTNVSIFPSVVSSFLKIHPEIRVRQSLRSDSNVYHLLDNGEIDMFISSKPLEGPDIQWMPFFKEELLLLVPREDRFLPLEEIPLSHVADEKFIGVNNGFESTNWLREICRTAGFTPNITFEGIDSAVIGEMVSLGLGVSFIPKHVWDKFSDILKDRLHVLKITEPNSSITTGVSIIKDRYLSSAAEAFYHFIRDSMPV